MYNVDYEVIKSNILNLRIKKSLTTHWSDLTYEENCIKVKEDLTKIEDILKTQSILVISPELMMNAIAEAVYTNVLEKI